VAFRPSASMACVVSWLEVSRWDCVSDVSVGGVLRCYLDEENVCACFCEGNGHCLTDTSCASCDEGCLALEGE
jgi:hypothetical protein